MRKSTLNRLVRDEISSILFMAEYGYIPKRHTDSMRQALSTMQKKRIHSLAVESIRIHDAKYNDFIGTAAFSAFMVARVIPFLIPLLKATVIGAATSSLSGSLKQKIVDPIIERIVNKGKQLVAAKGENSTYTETIVKGIKQDMEKLMNVFRKEKAYVSPQLSGLYQKVRNLV